MGATELVLVVVMLAVVATLGAVLYLLVQAATRRAVREELERRFEGTAPPEGGD